MGQEISLSCSCGKLRGRLKEAGPDVGDRFICHCSDCRDFIRFLGKEEEALTDHGGVSVYQTRVAQLEITQGVDQLAAVHMTEKPTTRWYTTCCNTPVCNTLSKAKPAFLSLQTVVLDPERVDSVLGPSKGNIFPDEATPANPPGKSPSAIGMSLRFLPRILKDSFGSGWRKSPLFDAETKEPVAKPRHLTAEEKLRLGRT